MQPGPGIYQARTPAAELQGPVRLRDSSSMELAPGSCQCQNKPGGLPGRGSAGSGNMAKGKWDRIPGAGRAKFPL